MPQRTPRRGLTRPEVLAAAGLAVFAAGLVLPKVQAARADAAREQCRNNLRTLGRAFLEYEKSNGGFAPRRSGFNDGNPYAGWGAHVLPYTDQAEVAKKYNFKLDCFDAGNKAAVETQVATFICPAAPSKRVVPILSQASSKSDNPDKDTLYKVDGGPNDYIASNGVLFPRTGYGANVDLGDQMNGNQRQPTADNVDLPLAKITDGISCTLLLIEQAGRPDSWRLGKKTNDGAQFGMAANARGMWAGWGSIAFGPSGADGGPARGDATDCSVNCSNTFGIYGFHDAGATVLLCDGSVRFVGKKLDPLTFVFMTIRDDGHLIGPTDY